MSTTDEVETVADTSQLQCCGLESLPNEIFFQILSLLGRDCLHKTKERFHAIAILSRVSRRFRDGVAATQVFWAYWDVPAICKSEDVMKLHIDRGPIAGVILELFTEPVYEERYSILVSPSMRIHLERITVLRLRAWRLFYWLEQERATIEGLTFPSVEALEVYNGPSGSRGTKGFAVLRSWKYPVLRKVTLDSFILHPDTVRDITHLTLSFDWDKAVRIGDVKPMLREMQSLTHLEMVHFRISSGGNDEQDVVLPNLISLKVHWGLGWYHWRAYYVYIWDLKMPRLRDLHISMASQGCGMLRAHLDRNLFSVIRSIAATSTCLQYFSLHFEKERGRVDNSMTPIPTILLAMPTLETILIEFNSGDPFTFAPFKHDRHCGRALDFLRTLQIKVKVDDEDSLPENPYLPLHELPNILRPDVDVIIVTNSDERLSQAREFFPQARKSSEPILKRERAQVLGRIFQ